MKQFFVFLVLVLLTVARDRNGGGSPTDPSQVVVEFSTTDLVVGTGAEAVAGSLATFNNWELFLYDPAGTASKGARVQGQEAGVITYTVGGGQLIPGFDQGVRGMRVGGKRRMYIPPSLAYGSQGNGPIPPNASIVFEVELTSVE